MSHIVIVGGGVVGSSTAWHLARAGHADRVRVIEPDPTYERAATPKSMGGIRVLYSTPENILMSLYGHEIYGGFEALMAVGGEPAHLGLRRYGYLQLAENAADLRLLEEVREVQVAAGADVRLLDREGLREVVPPVRLDDIVGGVYTPGDGYLDPHAALMGFRRKAVDLGVTFVRDRVVGLETGDNVVRAVALESGERIAADHVVNAANCWAPEICAMLGMRVPVAPMPRQVFYFECREELPNMPLTRCVTTAGSFRNEGAGFLSGISIYDAPRGFDWEVKHSLFEEILWPVLAHRVPAFEAIRVRNAWVCHYDQNALDAQHIIGGWPGHYDNFLVACGLSGHGLQHAPAIGRALTELILHGSYQTIDLTRLGYQRIIDGEPLLERGVIA